MYINILCLFLLNKKENNWALRSFVRVFFSNKTSQERNNNNNKNNNNNNK